MNDFQGKKWRCVDVKLVKNQEVWWNDEYIEKKEFAMTRAYSKYLKEKRNKENLEDLQILKSKLEYQMKTYGEVDKIDFLEYQMKIKEYYSK